MRTFRPSVVCLLAVACAHPAPTVTPAQKAEQRDEWLTALRSDVDRLAAADGFQGAVRATHAGKVELDRQFGDARCLPLGLGRRILATLALAGLVEQGKVHFDDRVGQVLPALRGTTLEPLLLSHLLTNSAAMATTSGRTVEESLVAAGKVPLIAPAGTLLDSSDPRPWLLVEQVVTTVGGQPFDAQVQERVLQRSGTTGTTLGPTAECPEATRGVTTALDQMRVADALRTGKLVQPGTREQLWTPRIELQPGVNASLGFAVRTGEKGEAVGLGSSGTYPAYDLWIDPTSGDTVVLVGSSNAKTAQSVRAAVTEFFGLPPPPPHPTSTRHKSR